MVLHPKVDIQFHPPCRALHPLANISQFRTPSPELYVPVSRNRSSARTDVRPSRRRADLQPLIQLYGRNGWMRE
jgi:hypothetical protein